MRLTNLVFRLAPLLAIAKPPVRRWLWRTPSTLICCGDGWLKPKMSERPFNLTYEQEGSARVLSGRCLRCESG